jgi:hypothetical protein
MVFVRYVLPALFVVAGIVILLAGNGSDIAVEGWALFTGAGAAILLMNVFFRIGAQGDTERDREEAARVYLDEHGHWPDEPSRT